MILFINRKFVGYIGLALVIFGFYDVLLHSVFVIAHGIFEWVELGLEKLVEHLLGTTRKQSQVIVFYSLLSIMLFIVYRLCLQAPALFFRLKKYLSDSWLKYKNQFLIYFRNQPLIKKIKILTACIFGLGFVYFFTMS